MKREEEGMGRDRKRKKKGRNKRRKTRKEGRIAFRKKDSVTTVLHPVECEVFDFPGKRALLMDKLNRR